MYELSRVKLFSVGPPGARYQDVCLDLRGIGSTITTSVPQLDMFAPDDLERRPRRPAPASVLFLENGGGKSVLLKLIFSVLLPGRRQVVGTTSSHVLDKFVLGDDVAHVALEWMHTTTGQLLVTGKVSEWRGHMVSSDPDKLTDAWYSFRPGPDFGLDDLPVTVDRRRVTMSAFRDRIDEENRRQPAIALVWETVQREWSDHLIEVGLDPELFRYQRAMNAGEGEAADAFSFPTDEAFVDFLLRAVMDPDEPGNLAELVTGYATKIAERADLEREREFVDGALELLEPVAEAEEHARVARHGEATARGEASTLAASISYRQLRETDRLTAARTALDEATQAAYRTGNEERRLQEITTELHRLVAVLAHREAETAELACRRRKDEAEALTQAWQAVDPMLRCQVAEAEAQRLRRVLEASQERARPAFAARQDAATALAGSLHAMAAEADEAAAAAEAGALAAKQAGAAARRQEMDRANRAAGHQAGVDQAHAALGAIQDQVSAAVRAGLLRAEHDVAEVAARAEDDEQTARSAVAALRTELGALRQARRTAEAEVAAASQADTQARTAAAAAEGDLRRAEDLRAALADEPRLAALLGTDTVDPETDTPALLDGLREAIDGGERERTGLLAARERDTRALRALGDGGLLPEPTEIEQALAILEGVGITAYSGWRYLTTLPEHDRAEVIGRLPHLVAGVLLNDSGDAVRAREELEGARLLPSAMVAIASTGALTRAGTAPGIDFVVPPNPAMYDEAAAELVRAELVAEAQRQRDALAHLDEVLRGDRTLLDRLRAWRDQYPSGAVADLASDHAAAADRAARTGTELEQATRKVSELDRRADDLEQNEPRLEAASDAAHERAAGLTALRTEVAKGADLHERIRQETRAAQDARLGADAAAEAAEQARTEAEEATRRQDRAESLAHTARTELAELPVEAEPLTPPAPGTPPLEVLRTEYQRSCAAYAAAEVGADLRSGLAAAEQEERSARGPVDALPATIVALAETLLRTPDGSAPSSRRAAAQQARRELDDLVEQLQAAVTQVAMAKRASEEHKPLPRSLEPYGPPEDIAHGRLLIARAESDHRAADIAAREARAGRTTAEGRLHDIEVSASGFEQLANSLEDLAPTEHVPGSAVFEGDLDSAGRRWTSARSGLREAGERLRTADRELRQAVDQLTKHAQEPRFESVPSPVRRHMLGIAREEMPALAAEWQQALRPRLRSLRDDLANIGRHRSGIVTRLHGMVGEALRTLKLAQRLSQLPDGLSDWSGQQFLRIRFEDIAEAVLLERLGEVVDDTAERHVASTSGSASGRSAGDRRDGMSLLLRGVRAAMPKGVRVEMLKPDAVLRTERLRVSEIRDVFSGGQQLTAAIILYCTMAALRANQRGQGRRAHAGVLFLDNPIGRASAGYLLELQFGVAHALGVQLIYTTGLFDAGALSTFPLVIRLRNDADLRAGRKYLSIDSHIARQLGELPPDDGTGRIAAVRIFRRPQESTS